MGKSSGYRSNKANKEEYDELRSELAKCHIRQWQKATAIMQRIVEVTGHKSGPSNSLIEPRACKYCGYYGHTRQHCKRRKSNEEAEIDYVIRMNENERVERLKEKPKVLMWFQREKQEDWFEELGVKWERDPYVGPILSL